MGILLPVEVQGAKEKLVVQNKNEVQDEISRRHERRNYTVLAKDKVHDNPDTAKLDVEDRQHFQEDEELRNQEEQDEAGSP